MAPGVIPWENGTGMPGSSGAMPDSERYARPMRVAAVRQSIVFMRNLSGITGDIPMEINMNGNEGPALEQEHAEIKDRERWR